MGVSQSTDRRAARLCWLSGPLSLKLGSITAVIRSTRTVDASRSLADDTLEAEPIDREEESGAIAVDVRHVAQPRLIGLGEQLAESLLSLEERP